VDLAGGRDESVERPDDRFRRFTRIVAVLVVPGKVVADLIELGIRELKTIGIVGSESFLGVVIRVAGAGAVVVRREEVLGPRTES